MSQDDPADLRRPRSERQTVKAWCLTRLAAALTPYLLPQLPAAFRGHVGATGAPGPMGPAGPPADERQVALLVERRLVQRLLEEDGAFRERLQALAAEKMEAEARRAVHDHAGGMVSLPILMQAIGELERQERLGMARRLRRAVDDAVVRFAAGEHPRKVRP